MIKMDVMTAPQEWNQNLIDCHLVAGCSIGHKSQPFSVSRLDMGQTHNSKYTLEMVGVILSCSYFADAC